MSDLYKKLFEHREKLRNEEDRHTPSAVIGDEPLKALARTKPTSLEDMLKISGIGKAFVTKYGDGFLDVILSQSKPVKLTMMRKEAKDTLKNLQARLTNINRRNRMLYLPRPVPGRAMDLFGGEAVNNAVLDACFAFNGENVTIADSDDERYMQFNRLIRAADSGARETGNNTLYVGYPFVIGRCGTDSAFNVLAPLAFFPVSLKNDNGKIVLSTDDSRDITYNSALILCYNKFNGNKNEPLPPCSADDVHRRDFLNDIIKFYGSNGIKLSKVSIDKIIKYVSYNDKNFPKFAPNEYVIRPCAVIGMFPMYSGEMQKDFDDIIDSGLMPQTLNNLLEGADEVDDFYSDSIELVDGQIPIDSEGNISYISELNVSQELAIEKIGTERALVMQGPPGTGKSQTITSMISDCVNKGKNVLVVSQKHAALSVIYSRLGKLAKYALFIDDSKDKQSFYGRLKAMFDSAHAPSPFNPVALTRSVNAIDGDISTLTEVADSLQDDTFGAPMLRIFAENFDNPFKKGERDGDKQSADLAERYRTCVPDALLDCGYDEVCAASATLADGDLVKTLCTYYGLAENYPWLVDMHRDLSGAQLANLMSALDGILDVYAYDRFKFRFKKKLKLFLKSNFTVYSRPLYKRFVKDPVELYNGIKAYNDFFGSKIIVDGLETNVRLYFGALYNLSCVTEKTPGELNGSLKDYCGYAYIDRYEKENRQVHSHIEGYASTVGRICAAIDKKQQLTRDKTLNLLKSAFNENIAESKRRGDILRAIDGKRRIAVSKFVEKFEFELFRGVRIFLMTPEAVSDVLPLKNDLFDLLVFDEASQIYVERGIPAIYRAARLVVCGDHKQLRPSSLGDGRVTVDEEEENEAVLEEESLLDIARFKFPEVMLSYHYRSRYEELIAFSNAAFYGGRLNISPDPVPSPVTPITVYKVNGRWEDRVNTVEANKVLDLVTEYLMSFSENEPHETLGVITFNAQQRDCILDLIDKKCDSDPEFRRRYFTEFSRREDGEDVGLFVKNIENVQGDERDRIIFSFAYAYNKKGVMSRNFGWLNRPGGENRLNVAISRAKKKIDIVTSIIPTDLRVDDIKSEGVHVLRKYLDYAYCVSDGDKEGAKRVLETFLTDADASMRSAADSEGSDLKNRVKLALEQRGLTVDSDVGMGSYRLDLAVKDRSGRYALGIECDDSAYGSGASTRERDVMRRKFLESRGWKLYRVWTCDWYEDPDRVVKDICAKLSA